MIGKRFTDDGVEEIEDQSFTDNLTGKTYWIDNGLDEIIDILNKLNDENVELCIQNNFLKDENQHMRDLVNENKQLKQKIQDLRINILDSLREADEIQCTCSPCVAEECVKRVIE